jgi:hypothetical protein
MGNMIYGNGMSSGTATTTTTPVYRYRRAVAFQARLPLRFQPVAFKQRGGDDFVRAAEAIGLTSRPQRSKHATNTTSIGGQGFA